MEVSKYLTEHLEVVVTVIIAIVSGIFALFTWLKQQKKEIPRLYNDKQSQVYSELWDDVVNITKRLHIAQIPFDDRNKGLNFHIEESELGYQLIKKIDKLAPFFDINHYQKVRDFATSYCNYHADRKMKYQDLKNSNPSEWTENDKILWNLVFIKGRMEMEIIFREVISQKK